MDDDLADVADRLPGFGGLFYDSRGGLVVYLVDPSTVVEARQAVGAYLTRDHPEWAERVARDVASMRVVTARFDFRQLYDWYLGTISPLVGGISGVTVTDIDDRNNRIMVGVTDANASDRVRAALASVNLPEGLVDIVHIPPVALQADNRRTHEVWRHPEGPVRARTGRSGRLAVYPSVRNLHRPVMGGVQEQFQPTPFTVGTCTLGYNIVQVFANGQLDTLRYFATNAHCTDAFGTVTEMAMGQNTPADVIGAEVNDPMLFSNTEDSRCPSGRACRYSDAALFQYSSWWDASHASVAFPPVGSLEFFETRLVVAGVNPPAWMVGLNVDKVGRTTGHTRDVLGFYLCADFPQFDQGVDTGRTMLCQANAYYASGPGDSGSPVFWVDADGNLADLGIHWGANQDFAVFSMHDLYSQELAQGMNGTLTSSGAF